MVAGHEGRGDCRSAPNRPSAQGQAEEGWEGKVSTSTHTERAGRNGTNGCYGPIYKVFDERTEIRALGNWYEYFASVYRPEMAAVAAAIMKGESYGAEAGKTLERSAKKLMHHPYITSQIRSGRALNPVPRTIYSPGIIWKDHSEKETWEREGSKGSQTIQRSRTTLLKQAKAHPLWLQLPLYDT